METKPYVINFMWYFHIVFKMRSIVTIKKYNMSYCKLILARLVSVTLFRCHQIYCTVLLHNVTYIRLPLSYNLALSFV